jgi:hypothetical protein
MSAILYSLTRAVCPRCDVNDLIQFEWTASATRFCMFWIKQPLAGKRVTTVVTVLSVRVLHLRRGSRFEPPIERLGCSEACATI